MTLTMTFQLKKSRERYWGEIKEFGANTMVIIVLHGY